MIALYKFLAKFFCVRCFHRIQFSRSWSKNVKIKLIITSRLLEYANRSRTACPARVSRIATLSCSYLVIHASFVRSTVTS